MSVLISGVGAALPSTVVGNDAFASLGITHEWIVGRTGIERRHWLQPDERLVDLAADAGKRALADAGLAASDVDFIVAATITPDRVTPGLAPELGHLLGATSPGAVDVNGACTGFLYALDTAIARVDRGCADRVLVVGADAMSRLVDRTDRKTAALFGDAAGAVVVEAARTACHGCDPLLSFGSSGDNADTLYVDRAAGVLRMDGAEVYAAAVEAMAGEIDAVLRAGELDRDDVDLLVCHQANSRILRAVAGRLNWPSERIACYTAQFGNTSSASIPVALWQAQDDGRLRRGDTVVLSAFGAGFTWGAGVVTWKACGHGNTGDSGRS